MNEDELYDRYQVEFTRLAQRADQLAFTAAPLQWLSLLSMVQLACRHPENGGPTRQIAEDVARQIGSRLATGGSALATVIERGWQSQYDLPRWNPVPGDRMPAEGQQVWVAYKTPWQPETAVSIAMYEHDQWRDPWGNDLECEPLSIDGVTHWQPLIYPKPPEEQ